MLRLQTQCRENQPRLDAGSPAGEGPARGQRGRGCCSALLTHRPLPAGTSFSLLMRAWIRGCMGKVCRGKAALCDTATEQCLSPRSDALPHPPAASKSPRVAPGGLGSQGLTWHLRRHSLSALLSPAGFVPLKTAHENGLLKPTEVTLLQNSSSCSGMVVFFVVQNTPRAPG